MLRIRELDQEGMRGWELANSSLRLFIPRDFGPRILGLHLGQGPNLLAVLPQARISIEGFPAYSLRGGHRLWAAPEAPEVTYAADDSAPEIQEREGGLDLRQEVDRAGLQKTWQIRMDPEQAQVVILHGIRNLGSAPIQVAPWAVTMLEPGGVGLLPLRSKAAGAGGLSPDRSLVVWPYSDLESDQIEIGNQAVFVDASLTVGALKIGSANPPDYLAYSQNGVLFVKCSSDQPARVYPDRGASRQIYCDPGAIELETLGPLQELAPGDGTEHQEIWHLYQESDWPADIKKVFDQRG